MPYVIRNCPARLPSGFCIEAPKKKAYLCQDCTDCVLKQIVELCREENYAWLAKEILQKLDIQECK